MARKIVIERDPDPESPREWDNLGTMVCWHRRYNLGDEQPEVEPFVYLQSFNVSKYYVLSLYLYDHSDISISTTPFSCPWDSGMIGFIYIDKDKAPFNWQEILEAEVKAYDQYLRGEVYGFVVTDGDDVFDSCWGFYSPEDCIEYAKTEHPELEVEESY